MTTQDFKIWLVTNGYTQVTLAKRLNIHANTISNYCVTGGFPTVFKLALKYIADNKDQ